MKLTKLLILLLLLSIKGFSQQAVLTSSGEKVILNFLSSLGGTITGTLGITGNTTISGTTTLTGINNTGTITNTGALINTGNLTVNGNGTITGTLGVTGSTTITGTLTLPSLTASTLIGTDGSKGVATGNLTGDITTSGFAASIATAAVTTAKIATGAVAGFHIQDLAITDAKVTDVSATKITGTLAISQGGTNSTATPTAGGIGYGTGTAHAYTVAGTAGQILSSNGAGVPTWTSAVITTTAAPSLSNSPGIKGEIRIDANYIYVCIETNTWKRLGLVAFDPVALFQNMQ